MNQFALIFRQGSRVLTEAGKDLRSHEVSIWARGVNAAGHALQPHILGPETVRLGTEIADPEGEAAGTILAILLLQARDLQEAARVAESHPGLRFGSSVEVRPWARPNALPSS